jgi:hypothetical protein
VVFNLDVIGVENRGLYYEALNQALLEEANNQYVITRDDHEK